MRPNASSTSNNVHLKARVLWRPMIQLCSIFLHCTFNELRQDPTFSRAQRRHFCAVHTQAERRRSYTAATSMFKATTSLTSPTPFIPQQLQYSLGHSHHTTGDSFNRLAAENCEPQGYQPSTLAPLVTWIILLQSHNSSFWAQKTVLIRLDSVGELKYLHTGDTHDTVFPSYPGPLYSPWCQTTASFWAA